MNPFESVRALALDLDNTLIDFSGSRKAGLDAVLTRIAAEGFTVDRQKFLARHSELARAEDALYLAKGEWTAMPERFRALATEFSLPSDGFASTIANLYTETRFANLFPYPETRAALKELKARFPLYLVTNGPPSSQHREIAATGLASFFKKMFVCEDFGLRKPDPRMFEKIRAEAAVPNDAMMIVGDFFEADIEVPRKLLWRTAWVVRDDAERAAADPARADAVVRSVADVPALLAR